MGYSYVFIGRTENPALGSFYSILEKYDVAAYLKEFAGTSSLEEVIEQQAIANAKCKSHADQYWAHLVKSLHKHRHYDSVEWYKLNYENLTLYAINKEKAPVREQKQLNKLKGQKGESKNKKTGQFMYANLVQYLEETIPAVPAHVQDQSVLLEDVVSFADAPQNQTGNLDNDF